MSFKKIRNPTGPDHNLRSLLDKDQTDTGQVAAFPAGTHLEGPATTSSRGSLRGGTGIRSDGYIRDYISRGYTRTNTNSPGVRTFKKTVPPSQITTSRNKFSKKKTLLRRQASVYVVNSQPVRKDDRPKSELNKNMSVQQRQVFCGKKQGCSRKAEALLKGTGEPVHESRTGGERQAGGTDREGNTTSAPECKDETRIQLTGSKIIAGLIVVT